MVRFNGSRVENPSGSVTGSRYMNGLFKKGKNLTATRKNTRTYIEA